MWVLAIVLALVVTGIVAVLLLLIIRTAADIEAGCAEIWARGQRVANNTIHLANLHRTEEATQRILGRAGRILGHVKELDAHVNPEAPR
ncbi:hypothetical protein [Roseomonas sp. HF4]|uniref:hypothetical protein n=1 Tax=Roseomonas sp. HF4 TaxID=2562313 RepID=UPI0010C15123|nr:hypothetical protein [Roseomonas sp. HF4]